jgi:hypothetical protein
MASIRVSIQETFFCSLERAFKSPMLCDVLKVHSGYLFMPKALSVANDQNWGQIGGSKTIVFAKSPASFTEMTLADKVIERIENKCWKIEVWNPEGKLLFFDKFVGEWEVNPLEPNKNQITYTYSLVFGSRLLAPLAWLFAHLFWKAYMGNVMRNLKPMAESNEPYLYP